MMDHELSRFSVGKTFVNFWQGGLVSTNYANKQVSTIQAKARVKVSAKARVKAKAENSDTARVINDFVLKDMSGRGTEKERARSCQSRNQTGSTHPNLFSTA